MEGLNIAMKNSCQQSLFSGVKTPNDGPVVSHLFYADDAMFIGEWEVLIFIIWIVFLGAPTPL